MKKSLSMAATLMTSLALLTGCSSTNTSDQNMVAGGVTGGVLGGLAGSLVGGGTGKAVAIGVGLVGGALLGGYIGKHMDSSDNANMNSTLTTNKKNQSTSWKNSKTGAQYTMTPTSNMMTVNGNANCRSYQTTMILNGKTKQTNGTACLQSNGTWKTITA